MTLMLQITKVAREQLKKHAGQELGTCIIKFFQACDE